MFIVCEGRLILKLICQFVKSYIFIKIKCDNVFIHIIQSVKLILKINYKLNVGFWHKEPSCINIILLCCNFNNFWTATLPGQARSSCARAPISIRTKSWSFSIRLGSTPTINCVTQFAFFKQHYIARDMLILGTTGCSEL